MMRKPSSAEFNRSIVMMPPAVGERVAISTDRRTLTVSSAQPAKAIVELVKWIDQQGIELTDIHLKRPTLEDVFIELTGKRLRE